VPPLVFVLNCGSSSLKYRLLDLDGGHALAAGLAERIGEPHSRLVHRAGEQERATDLPLPDHAAALDAVLEAFAHAGGDLADAKLAAVAHRVVHGGTRFTGPELVDDGVVAAIRALGALAPLHNAIDADVIDAARRALPHVPHVAVFDTAFHHTLPPRASTYAVPREWEVRRYGFHGTSVAFVTRAAARLLGRAPEDVDLIVLHLGNGASATAVGGGRSVDTSMGLTPLEGLVMGTRAGDVDAAIVAYLHRAGLGIEEIDRALNERSGMLALAGDDDLRGVHARIAAGDEAAALALDVYCYRIRKYVGAYLAALGGADAIVFTGGVGEHDAVVRARALAGLERLGIAVDDAANAVDATTISPPGAVPAVLVIPTDEELEMATQAAALITTARPSP
jgi:acetate kinase